MKNTKRNLGKMLAMAVAIITVLLIMTVPAFATDTTPSPQIEINSSFDANDTIRSIFNWLIGILVIIGAGVGGVHIVLGQVNQDFKERNGGIITLIISIAVGGLMLLILNMILV